MTPYVNALNWNTVTDTNSKLVKFDVFQARQDIGLVTENWFEKV